MSIWFEGSKEDFLAGVSENARSLWSKASGAISAAASTAKLNLNRLMLAVPQNHTVFEGIAYNAAYILVNAGDLLSPTTAVGAAFQLIDDLPAMFPNLSYRTLKTVSTYAPSLPSIALASQLAAVAACALLPKGDIPLTAVSPAADTRTSAPAKTSASLFLLRPAFV